MGNCCIRDDSNKNIQILEIAFRRSDKRSQFAKSFPEENIGKSEEKSATLKYLTPEGYIVSNVKSPLTGTNVNDNHENGKEIIPVPTTACREQNKQNPNSEDIPEKCQESSGQLSKVIAAKEKQTSYDFANGKESYIKENSHNTSENFSLKQEKEKIFPNEDKMSEVDTILNNFDITYHSNSINSSFLKKRVTNSMDLPANDPLLKKLKRNNKHSLSILDTVKETKRENMKQPKITDNSLGYFEEQTKRSEDLYSQKRKADVNVQMPVLQTLRGPTKKRKKISMIKLLSANKKQKEGLRKTLTSESNLSTERLGTQEEALNHICKLKEIELILNPMKVLSKRTRMDQEESLHEYEKYNTHSTCCMNILSNYTTTNTENNKNKVCLSKFQYLFQDTVPKNKKDASIASGNSLANNNYSTRYKMSNENRSYYDRPYKPDIEGDMTTLKGKGKFLKSYHSLKM